MSDLYEFTKDVFPEVLKLGYTVKPSKTVAQVINPPTGSVYWVRRYDITWNYGEKRSRITEYYMFIKYRGLDIIAEWEADDTADHLIYKYLRLRQDADIHDFSSMQRAEDAKEAIERYLDRTYASNIETAEKLYTESRPEVKWKVLRVIK